MSGSSPAADHHPPRAPDTEPAEPDGDAVPVIDHADDERKLDDLLIRKMAAQSIEIRIRRMGFGHQDQSLGPSQRRAFPARIEGRFTPGQQQGDPPRVFARFS